MVLCGQVAALATTRCDGDLRLPSAAAMPTPAAHRHLVDRAWALPRQVHGNRVLVLDAPSGPLAAEADAVVTGHPEAAVAVLGADCALVGLASPEGLFGVAHAGWRGLLAGVIEETAAALRRLGASRLETVLGPCIHPECYAFSEPELARLVGRYGPSVVGRTAGGAPALDLPAGVAAALAAGGAPAPTLLGGCTGCSSSGFSWRARAEEGRHALVLWRPTLATP